MEKFKSFVLRFVKGFVAGGVAAAVIILQGDVVIASLDDGKKLIIALGAGFVTGGLLAIEKMITWDDTPQLPQ